MRKTWEKLNNELTYKSATPPKFNDGLIAWFKRKVAERRIPGNEFLMKEFKKNNMLKYT